MQLKLSQFRLRGIAVLIVSRSKGVTLSFKTDPLEGVLVSSTFDSVASVRRHLQTEVENRLRDLFCEEIPSMLHAFSNEWLRTSGESSFPPASGNGSPFLERPYLLRKAHSPISLNDLDECLLFSEGTVSSRCTTTHAAQSAPAGLHAGTEWESVRCDSQADLELDVSEDESSVEDMRQHYFQKRNIISRAPSSTALPDPVLLDGSRIFRRQPSRVERWLKSLFSIPEGEGEGEGGGEVEGGLRSVSEFGRADAVGTAGALPVLLPRSYSGRSLRRSASVQYFDPETVQFEPDEFRSDYFVRSNRVAVHQRRATIAVAFPVSSKKVASQALGTKLSIRHRLQSTLALSTYSDKNIMYRTMSSSRKESFINK